MIFENGEWERLSRYAGPQQSPGFLLWCRFMRWQRGLNVELRSVGLTQPQFAFLAVCAWLGRNGENITQQAIVELLALDRMHVSQVLSRLENAGLIVRRRVMTDARVKHVELTAAGRERLRQAMPLVEAFDHRFFEERVDYTAMNEAGE